MGLEGHGPCSGTGNGEVILVIDLEGNVSESNGTHINVTNDTKSMLADTDNVTEYRRLASLANASEWSTENNSGNNGDLNDTDLVVALGGNVSGSNGTNTTNIDVLEVDGNVSDRNGAGLAVDLEGNVNESNGTNTTDIEVLEVDGNVSDLNGTGLAVDLEGNVSETNGTNTFEIEVLEADGSFTQRASVLPPDRPKTNTCIHNNILYACCAHVCSYKLM